MLNLASYMEMLMVLCFGISWPLNIVKAWRARSTKGTSVLFYLFIFLGYIAGIACKIMLAAQGKYTYNYVFFFYILNLLMVGTGILIYLRNRKLDKKNAS